MTFDDGNRFVSRARVRSVVTFVCTLAVVLAPSASARAPEMRSFRMHGSCVEVALGSAVDLETARRYIPAGFEPITAGGKALFAVFSEDCEMAVDGGELWPTVFTGAFFFVKDPGGSLEPHAYDILWGTDSKDLYKQLRKLGFGQYVPRSTFAMTSTAGQVHAIEADVPWTDSPFSLSATAAQPVPQQVSFTSVHWQVGKHGPVRGTYPHEIMAQAATGEIRAAPGSPIADILGAEVVSAGGVIFEFDFTGDVELVP